MNNTIAVIPARGGSKRIPQKNIMDFMGKPMIAWTVEAAKKSNIFAKILVSTDCPETAEIAQQYGADVPFLRQHNYDDQSPVSSATISALQQAEEYWQCSFDTVVQLMPNCPLRQESDIINSFNHFQNNQNTFQISCFKFGWMNPWWAFEKNSTGKPQPLFPHALKKRSQDLADLFCPTGSIWIAAKAALYKSATFYGKDYKHFCIDQIAAIDIDDYDDLKMARAFYHMQNEA